MPASKVIPRLVHASIADATSVVLAVSGGLDSMVLLDAAVLGSTSSDRSRVLVATFDHGTGAAAAHASALVSQVALSLGVAVVVGRPAKSLPAREAAWRTARWGFLRDVAAQCSGTIVTAHTRDDQVETVFMRALRGAGARGLAALYAPSPVRRPLIGRTRAELREYALSRGLRWVEDPTNLSTRFLRNRVRHHLLPALRVVSPGLEDGLLELSVRAAEWRAELAALVDRHVRWSAFGDGAHALDVVADDIVGFSREALAILWPELAGRVGLALDRRGTDRLAAFTIEGQVGARMQLSGGWQVMRARECFELRHVAVAAVDAEALKPMPLRGRMEWRQWSFRPSGSGTTSVATSPWMAVLPGNRSLHVRAWRPGDTMRVRTSDGLRRRKVKRFLTEAGISGHKREHWPVILCEDEIVWIPGVRRNDAETARSGGPVLTYLCELLDR